MKIYLAVLASLSTFLLTTSVEAQEPYLYYRVSHTVTVVIKKDTCPFPSIAQEYPYLAAAVKQEPPKPSVLPGCYKKLDEDYLKIQWYKGDFSVLPANAFLQELPSRQNDSSPKTYL